SGAVNVNDGTLQLDGGRAMGDLASVNLANAPSAILYTTGNETIGALAGGGSGGGNVILGSGTLTIGANNNSTTYAGVLSGAGRLAKTGTGATMFTGANIYTGAT